MKDKKLKWVQRVDSDGMTFYIAKISGYELGQVYPDYYGQSHFGGFFIIQKTKKDFKEFKTLEKAKNWVEQQWEKFKKEVICGK